MSRLSLSAQPHTQPSPEISSSLRAGPNLWLKAELEPGKAPQVFAFQLSLDEGCSHLSNAWDSVLVPYLSQVHLYL